MRILFFSNVYPNPLNPRLGTFNCSLVKALSEQHDLCVVSPMPWTDEVKHWLKHGKRFDRRSFVSTDGIPTEHPRYYYLPKIGRQYLGECLWRSVGPALCRRIDEFRPDAIISYWAHPDGAVAARAGQQFDIPTIAMVGGSDVLVLTANRKRRRLVLDALHQSDAVIPVSHDIADRLVEMGLPRTKLTVIHRGIDADVFSSGDRHEARSRLDIDQHRNTFIAAGRLVPVKGIADLITACKKLHQNYVDFACYVLGDGPLQGRLEQQIRSEGLSESVRLMGSQDQATLADWYRAADFVVLPSLSEGIPNVLLEAIACGTPFVASNVGGVHEICDPSFDRLVAPGRPHELAEAVAAQLDYQEPVQQRRFLPQSWNESAERVAAIVRSLQTNHQKSSFDSQHRTTVELGNRPEADETKIPDTVEPNCGSCSSAATAGLQHLSTISYTTHK